MKTSNAVVKEISRHCLLTRTRKIARIITGIYDDELRPFGINSPQLTLLVAISKLGPISRAAIGRYNHQDRSTLTRNLLVMLAGGWVEEVAHAAAGRSRPIAITPQGQELLESAAPAWRAAQRKAKVILGDEGSTAVINIANALPV